MNKYWHNMYMCKLLIKALFIIVKKDIFHIKITPELKIVYQIILNAKIGQILSK